MRYIHPVTDTLKTMLACGWSVDGDENRYRDTPGDTKHIRRQTITVRLLLFIFFSNRHIFDDIIWEFSTT